MTEERVMELFRLWASTHLPKRGSRGADEAKEPLAEYFAVGKPAIQRWIVDTTPVGEEMLRMRFFIQAAVPGSDPLAYTRKSLVYLQVAELIGFRIIPKEELQRILGFQNLKDVLRVSRGEGRMIRNREEKVAELHAEHAAQVVSKKAELAALVRRYSSEKDGDREPSTYTIPKETAEDILPSPLGQMEVLTIAGHQIVALTPLVEAITSDRFTSEHRKMLREMIGHRKLFDFANAINMLNGERARTIIKGKED